MKRVRNTLTSLIVAAGSLFSGGCAIQFPVYRGDTDIYSGVSVRGALDVPYYQADLGDKIQTTPVHPNDRGFLTGSTKAEPNNAIDVAPRVGLQGSLGVTSFRINTGADVRWNALLTRGGYRGGWYETEQQSSDIRPASRGSFVFTQITTDDFTFIPFVGMNAAIKNFEINAEAGFPYAGFNVESGHDRWGSWETVQDESWRGWGVSYGGSVGWRFDDFDEASVSLGAKRETYDAEFAGEEAEFDATLYYVLFKIGF